MSFPFSIPPFYCFGYDIVKTLSCQYLGALPTAEPGTSTKYCMRAPYTSHPSLARQALATILFGIGSHQGNNTNRSVIATPTAKRIDEIITTIPSVIRNIRHHNPQASLQVGLISSSICCSSFSCSVRPAGLPIGPMRPVVSSIHYKYGYQCVSI
jgi:hypothetical protein